MANLRQSLMFAVVMIAALAANQAPARGVGLVLDVQGTVLSSHGTRETWLEITSVLEPDRRIRLGRNDRLSFVFYPTRELYKVEGPSVLAIGADVVRTIEGAKPAVKKISEERTQVAQTYDGRMTPAALVMKDLPGNAASIGIVSPGDGETVLGSAQEFEWKMSRVDGAVAFRLYEGERKLFEQTVAGHAVRLPDKFTLTSGARYRWTVAGTAKGTQVEASATFSVADGEQLARLRRMQPDDTADAEEWVLYGVALEELGAASDARSVWRWIARMRPGDPAVKGFVE